MGTGRGEQSIDIQGEDNKKRGGSGQGAAANARGDHDTGLKNQSAVTWTMMGMVKSGFIMDMWLVDKNEGDNYVIIFTLVGYFPCGDLCHGSNVSCMHSTNCYK